MRTYSVTDYPKKHKDLFNFLVGEYGFEMTNEIKTDFSYISEYTWQDIRIVFNYDTKDNFFYFTLIRGARTKYPNDKDRENIRPLIALFQKFEPNIDVRKLMPDDAQYLAALEQTAALLRKHGANVLKGFEWF